jgi:excisionase family DNA binding protein
MTARLTLAPDSAAMVRQSARVARVAELLDLDESAVYRMVRTGELEGHGHGIRGVRVYLDSVAAWQASRDLASSQAAQSRAKLRAQRSAVSRAAQASALAELRKSGILP